MVSTNGVQAWSGAGREEEELNDEQWHIESMQLSAVHAGGLTGEVKGCVHVCACA